jgi:hypothetical protein
MDKPMKKCFPAFNLPIVRDKIFAFIQALANYPLFWLPF